MSVLARAKGVPPADGLELEVCYGAGDQMRVSVLFDTCEQLEPFGLTITPLLEEIGFDSGEPEVVEVHKVIRRGEQEAKTFLGVTLQRGKAMLFFYAVSVVFDTLGCNDGGAETSTGRLTFQPCISYAGLFTLDHQLVICRPLDRSSQYCFG